MDDGKIRVRFKLWTLLLLILLIGALMAALRFHQEARLIPRPEADPKAAPIPGAWTAPTRPQPEPLPALLRAFRSEWPLAKVFSAPGMGAFARSGDARLLERILDDDSRTLQIVRWWWTQDVDCVYAGEWRCNLRSWTFYRPFTLEGGRRCRISGRFVLDSSKWLAKLEKVVRLMTREQFAAAGRPRRIDNLPIAFIPTPEEARQALVDWIRGDIGSGPGATLADKKVAGYLGTRTVLEALARGNIQEHPEFYEVDGWRIVPDDLSFDKPVPQLPGQTNSPVGVGGYFVLTEQGRWTVRLSYLREWDVFWQCEGTEPDVPPDNPWHLPPPADIGRP